MTQYEKMTKTPIPRLVVSLAIPTVITMMVTNIYNLVDTAFVGKLGDSASGAVGVILGYMSILQAVGFLFGQGAGSLMSRKLGEKDEETASRFASTGFYYSIGIGLLAAIFSLINIDWIVKQLGSTVTIAPYARTYVTYIILSAPFITSSFTLNNLLRYEGKARLGMIGMLTGAVLNIFGDFLFMNVLGMGIEGAGLSTAISQVIGFAILVFMYHDGKTICDINYHKVMFGHNLTNVIFTGFPSLLRQALNSVATIVLNVEAGRFGDYAVSAMSNVSKIMFFVFSIAIGIGQGFQPVSAFNYGAKKYKRLRSAYRFTFIFAEICMSVFVVVVAIFAPTFIRMLRDSDEVVKVGVRAMRLQCAAQILMPLCMTTEMLFQSTGKKALASIMSALRSGIFFIPCIIILARLRGLSGIQEAQPLAFALSVFPAVIATVWYFNRLPKEDEDELGSQV